MYSLSSISALLLVASSVDVSAGNNFHWPMGSYEEVNVEVGDQIALDCGDYEQRKTLMEFYNTKAFRRCDTSQAFTIDNTGAITFAQEGVRYFGCGDCGDGMKLRVTVEAKDTAPETYGKKKFVITKGARCKKGKVLARIKNKYVKACYQICNKNKNCYGFMHKAHNDKCILYGEPTYPKKRVGGSTCGWKSGGKNNEEDGNSEYAMYDSITVNVSLTKDSTSGGTALLQLFVYDKRLADAPASLVTAYSVKIPRKARKAAVPITLYIDPSVEQAGAVFKDMLEGSYYVALKLDESDLTYADSPAFDVAPGGVVPLLLKNKT